MISTKFAVIVVAGVSVFTTACVPAYEENVAIPLNVRAEMAEAPLARVAEPTPAMLRQQARGRAATTGGIAGLLISAVVATAYNAVQAAATGLADLPEVTEDLGLALETKMLDRIGRSTSAGVWDEPALTDEANAYGNRETRGVAMANAARAAGFEGYLLNAQVTKHGVVSEGAIGEEVFRYAVLANVSVVDVAAGIEVGRSVCTSNQLIGSYRDMSFAAATLAGRDVSEVKAADDEYLKAREVANRHNSINGPAPAVPPRPDLTAVSTPEERKAWLTKRAVEATEKCADPMIVKLLN